MLIQLLVDNIDRIIALIIVIGTLMLMCLGIDGEVKTILTMSATWAFASTYQARKAEKTTK